MIKTFNELSKSILQKLFVKTNLHGKSFSSSESYRKCLSKDPEEPNELLVDFLERVRQSAICSFSHSSNINYGTILCQKELCKHQRWPGSFHDTFLISLQTKLIVIHTLLTKGLKYMLTLVLPFPLSSQNLKSLPLLPLFYFLNGESN